MQLPWLVPDADRGALQKELVGAGQERMVRELWELMERYTEERRSLLVTEDLHWSDPGTLRLMDYFARRRAPMRLLWLCSFRLTQVIAEDHPLQELRQELRLHRLCEELPLDSFSESEVGAYVGSRMPADGISETFVKSLHAHTEGLPLFVVSVVESLLASDAAGGAAPDEWLGDGERSLPVPDNLAGAIEKQLARLPAATAAVLEAASVCGMEFRAATVAELLEIDATGVVPVCDELVRRQYWLRETGIVNMPDGAPEVQYEFRHAVYKHALYHRLTTTQRIGFHRRAARALERDRESGLPVTSVELASHHELGRDYRAATVHYGAAADSALAHYAQQEALQLTDRALALLSRCPANTERQELELALQATRGVACGFVHGIAAPATAEAFDRVIALCDALPPAPQRALLLNAIGWNLFTRCAYQDAIALAGRIHAVAASFDDDMLYVYGCNLLGVTYANLGRFPQAREWLSKGIEMCERLGERLGVQQWYVDPEASMYANLVPPLTQMGFADTAQAMVAKAVERADLSATRWHGWSRTGVPASPARAPTMSTPWTDTPPSSPRSPPARRCSRR